MKIPRKLSRFTFIGSHKTWNFFNSVLIVTTSFTRPPIKTKPYTTWKVTGVLCYVPIVFVRVNIYSLSRPKTFTVFSQGVWKGSSQKWQEFQWISLMILDVLASIECSKKRLVFGTVNVVQVVVAKSRLRVWIVQISFASI